MNNKKHLIDCHVHTTISHDGKSAIEDYIKIAESKNVSEITFTEHYDVYNGLKTELKTLDVLNYQKEFNKKKSKSKIKINFGIEIGLQPNEKDVIDSMLSIYDFDFIIASSHITCKKDMSKDNSFFDGYTRKEAYLKYFNEVLENIKLYDDFDVYGHLDYVVRYGGFDSKTINYEEFSDVLDKILIELIKKGKGIEINTSGFRYGLPSFHPNIDIVRRYKDLGGKIITIGSDAHKSDDLVKDFDVVFDALESLNILEIAVFHNRKPEFISIKNFR